MIRGFVFVGGEDTLKQLLIPAKKAPHMILAPRADLVRLAAGAGVLALAFKLLMVNLLPSVGELLVMGIATALIVLALLWFLDRVNASIRERKLQGLGVALLCLLAVLVVL